MRIGEGIAAVAAGDGYAAMGKRALMGWREE
jgi:hypothetical protein